MNPGTLFRARALKNVFGGDALARLEGQIVLVPGVIAGEEFVGEITAARRDYARAVVREIRTASPDRVTPSCPGAGRCPGCAYMHWRHSAEQQAKLTQLREFLAPLAPELDVSGVGFKDARPEGYRNKIRLQMRKSSGLPQLGYTAPDGRAYEVLHCRLACDAINRELEARRADPGFFHTLHDRMHLTLRADNAGVTVFRNQPSRNLPLLRETVLGRDFRVPPDGFFQVNPDGLKALTAILTEMLSGGRYRRVIDAYAGAGLFGAVAAAAGVPELCGIELDAGAADAARANWTAFGAKIFDFRTGDTAKLLPDVLDDSGDDTLLVLDPPRGGLEPAVARNVAEARKLAAVAYISCHPATLARDLGILIRGGFHPVRSHMVDMFPRSAHFETVTLLARQS